MHVKRIQRHRPAPKIQSAHVQALLSFLGMPHKIVYRPPGRSFVWQSFWRRHENHLEGILYDAKQCYMKAIKKAHPDRGGSNRRAANINAAWKRVQKLFANKGVTLGLIAMLLALPASADKLGSARGGASQLLKRTLVTSVPPKLPPIPSLRPLPNRRMTMVSLKPVTLAWDSVVNAASYKLCWGTQSGLYDNRVIFTNTTATIALEPNRTYYLAVSALGANGLESVLSTELVYTVPPAISTVTITVTIQGADGVAGPWRDVDLPVTRTEQTTNTQRYYRAVTQINR